MELIDLLEAYSENLPRLLIFEEQHCVLLFLN